MVKIFVGNLSDETTEQHLTQLFEPYGTDHRMCRTQQVWICGKYDASKIQ